MFTGIITETGIVTSRQPHFTVRASVSLVRKLKHGASVAVDGVCLTVVAKEKNSFSADVMSETLRRTTLGSLKRGAPVNLELPTTPATFLSGHIVQGHVDGVGVVRAIRKQNGSSIIEIRTSRRLGRYIAPKGSIALNGVSLTVIAVSAGRFTVGIIPHTWNETNLRALKRGDAVNIEVDVLAKYIEKFI